MSKESKPIKLFRPKLWPTLFMVAGVALTCSLGNWQVRRYQAQTAFAELYHRQHDLRPPVKDLAALGNSPNRLDELTYRRATLTGHLDTAHLQLLTARYVFGKKGFVVIAPLELPGAAHPKLLVHLGWVPEGQAQALIEQIRQTPDRTVQGRLQRSDARDPHEPPTGTALGLPTWMHPNTTAMALRIEGLDPDLMLQCGDQAVGDVVDPGRVPLDGYTYPVHPLPAKNIEYAITWFGVMLTLIAVWVALSRQEQVVQPLIPAKNADPS